MQQFIWKTCNPPPHLACPGGWVTQGSKAGCLDNLAVSVVLQAGHHYPSASSFSEASCSALASSLDPLAFCWRSVPSFCSDKHRLYHLKLYPPFPFVIFLFRPLKNAACSICRRNRRPPTMRSSFYQQIGRRRRRRPTPAFPFHCAPLQPVAFCAFWRHFLRPSLPVPPSFHPRRSFVEAQFLLACGVVDVFLFPRDKV